MIRKTLYLLPALAAAVAMHLPARVFAAEWTATPDEPLQALIERSAAGDHVRLPAGRYSGPLRVDHTLRLSGEPGAVIDGGGKGNAIELSAPNSVIEGLAIENWGDNLTNMDAAIFVERTASGSVIRDNKLHGPAFGIWLDAVADVDVLDNQIRGTPQLRSQDRGNGVHMFNVRNALVARNDIRQTRDGIYIDTSSHSVLRENHLEDLRYGVHYMYAYDNRVEGNVTRHTRTGYALMQSKRLMVVGNRSIADENYGILMNNITNSTLRGNRIDSVRQPLDPAGESLVSGSEGKAIFIYNSQFNRLEGNRFANSDIGIHLTAGSEDNVVAGNAFVSNRQQVMYVATRPQEWSENDRGNFWSDYLSWDLSNDGIGDTPYEPNDAMDRLLWRFPAARLLMDSPAVVTLRWVQRQFPVFRPQGVKDSAPLMIEPSSTGPGA